MKEHKLKKKTCAFSVVVTTFNCGPAKTVRIVTIRNIYPLI